MPRNELFIGSLPRDVSRRDIENIFDKYGRIERCDIKNRGKHSKQKQQRQETFYLFNKIFFLKGEGAVYAFLEFEDERDAEVGSDSKQLNFSKGIQL